MKKALCIAFAVLMLLLASCTSGDGYYKFEREGITEIKGITTMTEKVKEVTVSAEKTEQLLNQLESLNLEKTGEKNEFKGWEYSFTVSYGDGKTVLVSLSEKAAVIDGYVYNTSLYSADDYLNYFE